MCNAQLFHNKTLSFPSCPKAPPESKRPLSGASGHIAKHLRRMADWLPGACLLSPASQHMQPHIAVPAASPDSSAGSCRAPAPTRPPAARRLAQVGQESCCGLAFYMNCFITKEDERRWKQGGLNVQTSEGKCKIVSLNVTG